MKISLRQQIEEIDRELGLRDGVYRRQVNAGKLRKSVADMHMNRLRAARNTLAWLQQNEKTIKTFLVDEQFAEIRDRMQEKTG